MAKLISPTGKLKALGPVHPNAGIEAGYRRKMQALVDEMHASLIYWISAAYRQNQPEMAQDRSPAATINAVLKRLARRWQARFDKLAPDLASYFATSAAERSDATLKAMLRKGGMTVKFTLSAPANDALQAITAENVGLIRSIAQKHLADVQGAVMRSVASGRDLGALTKDLQARYDITRKRAAFIARDQNNKATAVITRVRQEALGITQARWVHSQGGRHPRPSHVKASKDGLIYDVAIGALIDGKRIWPGTEINCRCVSRAIIPGLD